MEYSPEILKFEGPFTAESSRSLPQTKTLQIRNSSQSHVAFKVKTTAPKLYCVRPNASVIDPQGSVEVSIVRQWSKVEPKADEPVRDKFLILTTPVANTQIPDLVAFWTDLESHSKDKITSKKILVKYVFNNPTDEQNSHTEPPPYNDSSLVTPSRAAVDDTLDEANVSAVANPTPSGDSRKAEKTAGLEGKPEPKSDNAVQSAKNAERSGFALYFFGFVVVLFAALVGYKYVH